MTLFILHTSKTNDLQMTLEQKLGQRVKERSQRCTTELRRLFKLLDKDGQGSLDVEVFLEFLHTWHIDCSSGDVQELLRKYDTGGATPSMIDMQTSLFVAMEVVDPTKQWLHG